jgi:hypothetical protein
MNKNNKIILILFSVIFTLLYLPLKLFSEYVLPINILAFYGIAILITGMVTVYRFRKAKKILGFK